MPASSTSGLNCVFIRNWVSSSLKRRYFPHWKKLSFVEIVEPEWHTDENKPTDRRLEGLLNDAIPFGIEG